MDQRQTNPANGNFLQQLKECHEKKQQVAILYEDGGVTRLQGLVTGLFVENNTTWIEMNGTLDIRIDALYAVNGIFSSDYTEC